MSKKTSEEELIKLSLLTGEGGGQIALLELQNLHTKNSMSMAMAEQFRQAIKSVSENNQLRALVLTGAGSIFSSGGDFSMLAGFANEKAHDNQRSMEYFYRSFLAISDLDIPTLAAVNGHAIGAAAALVLACDIRIVAQEAKMALNFTRVGIHPGMGSSFLAIDRLGMQNALYLMFTGQSISAKQALDMGLALELHPAEQVCQRTLAIAQQISYAAPIAIRSLKKSIKLSGGGIKSLDGAIANEAAYQAISYGSQDFKKAIASLQRKNSDYRFEGK